ncbi:hypothetical protein [Leuconostoc citreum]
MLEIKNPEKVDFYVEYDPASFGPVQSPDDIIDVYLQTDYGVVHFGASKAITNKQKQEVADKLNGSLGTILKQIDDESQ